MLEDISYEQWHEATATLPARYRNDSFVIWLLSTCNQLGWCCPFPNCRVDTVYRSEAHMRRHCAQQHSEKRLSKMKDRRVNLQKILAKGLRASTFWSTVSPEPPPIRMSAGDGHYNHNQESIEVSRRRLYAHIDPVSGLLVPGYHIATSLNQPYMNHGFEPLTLSSASTSRLNSVSSAMTSDATASRDASPSAYVAAPNAASSFTSTGQQMGQLPPDTFGAELGADATVVDSLRPVRLDPVQSHPHRTAVKNAHPWPALSRRALH